MEFAHEPTNSTGIHRIIRRYGDLFDVIAFGAVEPLEFKSCRPRRAARKLHVRAAFWAAELLNCEHWDCGWVICHCIPPASGGSATLSVTGRSRRGAVMGSVDSPYVLESTLETLIRRSYPRAGAEQSRVGRFIERWRGAPAPGAGSQTASDLPSSAGVFFW